MSPEIHTHGRRRTFLLLTCEHGGRDIPSDYQHLFDQASQALKSHRGYDIGALEVALRMAARLAAPIVFSTVSRLLIDLNRSEDQPDLFSEYSRQLPQHQRDRITAEFYTTYRDSVKRVVGSATNAGYRVLHVGVHSCTDVLHGQRRDLDIAPLFDPARPLELELCERWRDEILQSNNAFRCPFNEPYRGTDDGLTTTLRGEFPQDLYLGIEIEIRQGLILSRPEQHAFGELLADTLAAATPTHDPNASN